MADKVLVKWRCGHCGKKHRWKWDRIDYCPGTTWMRCKQCQEDTPIWLRKRPVPVLKP